MNILQRLLMTLLSFGFVLQAHAFETFKNGAPFFADKDSSLPRNMYLLSFQGGPALLTPEQQGILLIMDAMLKEGPSTMSLEEFNKQLFELGGEVDFFAEPNLFGMSVLTPPAEQEKVLALLKKTLENPRSSKKDFERYREKVLAGLRTRFEQMRYVVFYFGARDFLNYAPKTRNGETSPATLAKISYEDFKASLPKVLDYQRLFVSYVGQDDVNVAKAKVETAFQDKMQNPYKRWEVVKPEMPKLEKNKYVLINKPGATDNQILYIFPQVIQRETPEWAVAKVTMDGLGGGLHGDLGRVLRSERGLTYGAMSSFSSSGSPYWVAWTFGGLEQAKGLLTGVPEVIGKYVKAKLKPNALAESKSRLLNDYKTENELVADRLGKRAWFYSNGYQPGDADQFEKYLKNVKLLEANKFRSSLQSQVAAVYIMGDKSKIVPILEAMQVPTAEIKIIEISDIK